MTLRIVAALGLVIELAVSDQQGEEVPLTAGRIAGPAATVEDDGCQQEEKDRGVNGKRDDVGDRGLERIASKPRVDRGRPRLGNG